MKKTTIIFIFTVIFFIALVFINFDKLWIFIKPHTFSLTDLIGFRHPDYFAHKSSPNLLIQKDKEPESTIAANNKTSQCATLPTSSLVINVKDHGAKGDGISNDTAAIQSTIDKIAGTGGTVLLPKGIYMIDAITHLWLKTNMTFRMADGVILKAMPNNQQNYGILRIENAENVNLIGGVLQGERNQHLGNTGEWGMGLELYDTKNIIVEKLTAEDNWGDGFYVGNGATNTLFCSIIADNNRRQGMSITSANGVTIKNSTFKNTNGTLPMDGVDLEPNKGEIVQNIQILNSQFLNNKGSGIESVVAEDLVGDAFVKHVFIDSNDVQYNGTIGAYSAGIKVSRQSSQHITNNIVKYNLQDGIAIVNGAKENIITGNKITDNGNKIDKNIGYGILLYKESTENIVTDNLVIDNTNQDIMDNSSNNLINANRNND